MLFFFFYWQRVRLCGILVPGPGIEPAPLTTGPPGKVPVILHLFIYLTFVAQLCASTGLGLGTGDIATTRTTLRSRGAKAIALANLTGAKDQPFLLQTVPEPRPGAGRDDGTFDQCLSDTAPSILHGLFHLVSPQPYEVGTIFMPILQLRTPTSRE